MKEVILKITSINLFQFCNFDYSYYTKKEKYNIDDWNKKVTWLDKQINLLNSDIIVFQEVFTHNNLKKICEKNGFKYFVIVDEAILEKKTFKSCIVAIASRYPIVEILEVSHPKDFIFARKPLKVKIIKDEKELLVYGIHLKSNRLNEFEHKFTINTTLEEKFLKNKAALENKSSALFQRFNEVMYLSNDIKNELKKNKNIVLAGDFNDKLNSLCIEIVKSNDYLQDILNYNNIEEIKSNYKPQLFDAYDLATNYDYKNRKYTSYFMSMGNVIDFILVSENLKNVTSYKVNDEHLKDNKNGSLLNSDHAIISCDIKL